MKLTAQSTTNPDLDRRPVSRVRLVAIVLIVLTALVLTWTKGARQDYANHYLVAWELAISGQDPWSLAGGSGIAYGPAFIALAPLVAVHPLLPKYFFVVCWFGLAYWYLVTARSIDPVNRRSDRWLLAFFFAVPLFWIEIPVYGHFDILNACFCVAALHAYRRGHSALAGSLIAAGTLLKYYPVVLLPLFALQHHRIDWKLVGSFLIVTGLGFGTVYLLYGTSLFEALLLTRDWPSKMLSIFRFLRGPLSPTPNLDWLSGPCMLVSTLALLWFSLRHHIALSIASFALLLTIFTFFKVGHAQFYTTLFGLFPYLLLQQRAVFAQSRSLRLAALGFFIWIGIYPALYFYGHEFVRPPMSSFRDFSGLITFPLSLWLLLAMLRAAKGHRRQEGV